MLSCWHDLLFLFLTPTVLSFSSLLRLVVWVGVFGLIECSHSLPALHSRLQIIIVIIKVFVGASCDKCSWERVVTSVRGSE